MQLHVVGSGGGTAACRACAQMELGTAGQHHFVCLQLTTRIDLGPYFAEIYGYFHSHRISFHTVHRLIDPTDQHIRCFCFLGREGTQMGVYNEQGCELSTRLIYDLECWIE